MIPSGTANTAAPQQRIPALQTLPPELICQIALSYTCPFDPNFKIAGRLRSTCRTLSTAIPLSLLAGTFVRYTAYLYSLDDPEEAKPYYLSAKTDCGSDCEGGCVHAYGAPLKLLDNVKCILYRVLQRGCASVLRAIANAGFWELPPIREAMDEEYMRRAMYSGSVEIVQVLHQILLEGTRSRSTAMIDVDVYLKYISISIVKGHRNITEFFSTHVRRFPPADLLGDLSRLPDVIALAASVGWKEPLQLALRMGFPLNSDGMMARGLFAAAFNGHLEIVRYILSTLSGFDYAERTSIVHCATCALVGGASLGSVEIVQLALSYGADMEGICDYRKSQDALEAAAEFGHLNIIRFLIRQGFDMMGEKGRGSASYESHGYYALLTACKAGKSDVVTYLLSLKVCPNPRDRWTMDTPLCSALERGHTQILRLLLANRGRSDAHLGTGIFSAIYTHFCKEHALLRAIECGQAQAAAILLDAGAGVNKTKEELLEYALGCVMRTYYSDTVRVLRNRGAEISQKAMSLGINLGLCVLKSLLESGLEKKPFSLRKWRSSLPANKTDPEDGPLRACIHRYRPKMLRYLLDHDPDLKLDGVQALGWTLHRAYYGVCHWCTKKENMEMAKLLLAAGVDIGKRPVRSPRYLTFPIQFPITPREWCQYMDKEQIGEHIWRLIMEKDSSRQSKAVRLSLRLRKRLGRWLPRIFFSQGGRVRKDDG